MPRRNANRGDDVDAEVARHNLRVETAYRREVAALMKVHQSTVLGGYSLELNGTHRIVKVFRDEKTGKKGTMRLWGDLKHIPMEERRKIQLNPAEAPDQDCDGDDSDTEEELEREQVAESVRVPQVSKKRKTPEPAQPRRGLKRQKNSASSTGRRRKSGQVTAPCEPPAPDTVEEAPRLMAYPGGPRSRVVDAAIEEVAEEGQRHPRRRH